jgi:UDP-3-O-[3-hydroxymyristoyl] glucosamine N-acyltransferase
MIAHNCRIGRHNLICSQVGLAGSCTTGDYVVLAGQVGIKDHVNIGARTMLGAKSGVMQDVPADSQMVGAPATPIKEQMAIFATIQRLPEMRKQIRALERQVEVLRRAEAELVREAA